MRLTRFVVFFAAAVPLFAVGCSGDVPDSATITVPGQPTAGDESAVEDESAAVTPTEVLEPAGNPCEGARGLCEAVATVDVDGDGNPDNVGVELVDALITVRIDSAGELTMISVADQHIIRDDVTPTGVFVGAFHITRENGADIVVDAKGGYGGYELFGVVGWDEAPVLIPAPTNATQPTGLDTEWAVPTEGLRVVLRCPQPGSVGVVTTEGGSSYGVPTPGGAYTETVRSIWTNAAWSVDDTTRVPGEYVPPVKSARTGTFECTAVQETPPSFAPVAAEQNPNIVLGGDPVPNSQGYGEIRPPVVYFGGSPSGYIGDIVWDSWGGERAIGHGMAPYVIDSVADAELTSAEIVAYGVTTCDGVMAYSAVQWYFPSEGESFDPTLASGMC